MSSSTHLNEKIRAILLDAWDPIGVRDIAAARDEYDAYVAPIAKMARERRSASELSQRLLEIEVDLMGLPGDPVRAQRVAEKLASLSAA